MAAMSIITAVNDSDGVRSERETLSADSTATETMTSKREAFKNYKEASPGGKVEIADGTFLLVAGHGKLELVTERRTSR